MELHDDRPASQCIYPASAGSDRSEIAVYAVLDQLRPLLFGAAWKVLDLLIELALAQAGLRPDKHGRVPIAEKTQRAGAGHCPPLSTDPGLWDALTATYAATEQARHSLVHRRAHIEGAGSLVGADQAGAPLAAISAREQEALCRAAQRAAAAVLTGTLNARERSDLAAQLDHLAALHHQPVLGGTAARFVERVLVQARSGPSGRWRLDLPGWRQELRIRANATWFDLEISGPPGSPDKSRAARSPGGRSPRHGRRGAVGDAAMAADPVSRPVGGLRMGHRWRNDRAASSTLHVAEFAAVLGVGRATAYRLVTAAVGAAAGAGIAT